MVSIGAVWITRTKIMAYRHIDQVCHKLQPSQIVIIIAIYGQQKLSSLHFQVVLTCREFNYCEYRIEVMCDDAELGGSYLCSLMIHQPFLIRKDFYY